MKSQYTTYQASRGISFIITLSIFFLNNMRNCNPNVLLPHDRSRTCLVGISAHIKKGIVSHAEDCRLMAKSGRISSNSTKYESFLNLAAHMAEASFYVAEMFSFKLGWFLM